MHCSFFRNVCLLKIPIFKSKNTHLKYAKYSKKLKTIPKNTKKYMQNTQKYSKYSNVYKNTPKYTIKYRPNRM